MRTCFHGSQFTCTWHTCGAITHDDALERGLLEPNATDAERCDCHVKRFDNCSSEAPASCNGSLLLQLQSPPSKAHFTLYCASLPLSVSAWVTDGHFETVQYSCAKANGDSTCQIVAIHSCVEAEWRQLGCRDLQKLMDLDFFFFFSVSELKLPGGQLEVRG